MSKFHDITLIVDCTLEELFHGCYKTVCYERTLLEKDGKGTRQEKVEREVEIKPGSGAHTEIKFSQEGNEKFRYITSDVIIKVKEVPHSTFKKCGDDLVYHHKISLSDAIQSVPIHFKTIDGEQIEISVPAIIAPQTEHVLRGKGLPKADNDPLALAQ